MDDVGIRLQEEQVLELVENIDSLEMPLNFQVISNSTSK